LLADLLVLLQGDFGIAILMALLRASASTAPENAALLALAKEHPAPTTPYVVAHGETLSEIVRRELGQSYLAILPLLRVSNPWMKDPNIIRAGQVLLLPRLQS
jgi:nucleoid-associated protein YgaU